MPWKLISLLVFLSLVAAFMGFNWDHRADISFGFFLLEDVSLFLSLFVAFIAGGFFVLPYAMAFRKKKQKNLTVEKPAQKSKTARKSLESPEESPEA